jgi:DNA-binding PadR family transcriptional regulator
MSIDTSGMAAVRPGHLHGLLDARLQGYVLSRTAASRAVSGGVKNRVKFYALTAAGRRQLARELESWERRSSAIGLVVREAD